MPDVTTKTTVELLDQIGSAPLNSTQQAAFNELKNSRVIKEGDDDDIVNGGVETTRGGIRPKHAPLVP